MAISEQQKGVSAGIVIRLLASAYDGIILFGLCFIAFIPVTMAEQALGEMPRWSKGLLLLTIAYAYFAGFWVKGGATTGMRPWKLRVAMRETGDPISWLTASTRFAGMMVTWLALALTIWFVLSRNTGHPLFYLAAAIPAISLLVMTLSRDHQALHDLISGTGIYRLKSREP